MELHNLTPTSGSKKTKKRTGRGDKTAGRGENGQKSRSGYSKRIGFEGGQNPLYRRIPKRGFNNVNAVEYTVVNLDQLAKLSTTEITPLTLKTARVIKNTNNKIKILGNGKLEKPLTVSAHKFSASAKSAIEDAGGKIIILN